VNRTRKKETPKKKLSNLAKVNRNQVHKEVDHHLTWIKQKAAKKRIRHQSLGRENLVERGEERGVTK
jgi:hypothetical protein